MLNIPEKESTFILVSKFNEKFQTEKKTPNIRRLRLGEKIISFYLTV